MVILTSLLCLTVITLSVSNVLLLRKLRQVNQRILSQKEIMNRMALKAEKNFFLLNPDRKRKLVMKHPQLNDLDQNVKLSQQQSQLS